MYVYGLIFVTDLCLKMPSVVHVTTRGLDVRESAIAHPAKVDTPNPLETRFHVSFQGDVAVTRLEVDVLRVKSFVMPQ